MAAINLENALKAGNPVAATALLPLFSGAVAELCSTAQMLENPPPPAVGSPQALRALLTEVQFLLENNEADIFTRLGRLTDLLEPAELKQQADLLASAWRRLDADEALYRLQQIAEACSSITATPQ